MKDWEEEGGQESRCAGSADGWVEEGGWEFRCGGKEGKKERRGTSELSWLYGHSRLLGHAALPGRLRAWMRQPRPRCSIQHDAEEEVIRMVLEGSFERL